MRFLHIDFLKGVAIFLMVMGHSLSWCFEGGLSPNDLSIRIVRDIIYSFHMPLFMFMSGYVIDIKGVNFKTPINILTVERKRLKTLLVPSVTALFLGFILRDGWIELPWFLIALFLSTTIFCVIQLVCFCFKVSSITTVFLLLLGYIVLFLLNRLTKGNSVNEFLFLTETQIMYPYFIAGYLFNRYKIYRYFDRYRIYTILLIIFCLLFYLSKSFDWTHSVRSIIRYSLAFSGISLCYYISRNINLNSNISKCFSYLGVMSLQIYLLHYYFIPIFPQMGSLITSTVLCDTVTLRTTIFIQIVTGIICSVYCILMCLMFTKIISKSRLLNYLFFGKG